MIVGKQTIAKTTALINAGTHASSFVAPIFFGWALDATGNPNVGLYICVVALACNFVVMNLFFFNYKSRIRERAASAFVAEATPYPSGSKPCPPVGRRSGNE
jgi:hypothetical protein